VTGVPRASKALETLGNINLAVIYVQLEVGANLSVEYGVDASAFYISLEWWNNNITNNGTFNDMAEKFDKAYKVLVAQKIAEITQSDVSVGEGNGELYVEQTEDTQTDNSESVNKSYEMLENLGAALSEAENNAIAFAERVGFDGDETYGEVFLIDLVEHVATKYELNLDEKELDSIYEHVKAVFIDQQTKKVSNAALSAAAEQATEGFAAKVGQSYEEYTDRRASAFVDISRGILPSDTEPPAEGAETATVRQELLDNYVKFEDFRVSLDDESESLAPGQDSNAYPYEHEGKSYVVRIVKEDKLAENPTKTDDYVSALIHGKGVDGLEQITACSYIEAAVVSERAPGKSLEDLLETDPEKLNTITDVHLSQLFSVFESMQSRGLVADVNAGNLIYDVEQGFTLIDYMWCPPEYWGIRGQTLDLKIKAFEDLASKLFPNLSQRLLQITARKTTELTGEPTAARKPVITQQTLKRRRV
jgi:hypothetical protein